MDIDRRQSNRGNGNGKMPMTESGKRKNIPTETNKRTVILFIPAKNKKGYDFTMF